MDDTPPPRPLFETLAATGPACAMVFACPHSGDIYPADMEADPGLDVAALRSAEDPGVDKLIASAPRQGVPCLVARIGRAYVDLNRAPDDLDPLLIDGLGAASVSPRAKAGYGVAPRLTGDGRLLYRRRLGLAEVEARLARAHAPYHAALDELIAAARAAHRRVVLIDWHSMPARAAGGARGADVVLGDRHGASAAADVSRTIRQAFEAEGLRVAMNAPYAGGWTTQRNGWPAQGVHALQVELNRALYLDEASGQPGRGWPVLVTRLERIIARLVRTLG